MTIQEINKLAQDLRDFHFHEIGAGLLAEKLYEAGYRPSPEQTDTQPELKVQDILLGLTVLNQNEPKIMLTNDEAGWYVTYLPEPPTEEGKVQILGDNPLDALEKLQATVDSCNKQLADKGVE